MPPTAARGQGAGDSVVGGFQDFSTGLLILDIDARSDAAGGQPTGTVTWHFGGGLGPTWTGAVTCLSVDGGTAIVGFSGTFTFFSQLSPVAGLIRVVDGGGPDSRQDSFEWAETLGPSGGPPIPGPTACASYPAGFTPSSVVSVNGGWRNFGVFKNQGDGVSSLRLETGTRRQPVAERLMPHENGR